jgi:hypothetical protein
MSARYSANSDDDSRGSWKISPANLLGPTSDQTSNNGTASAGVGLLCARAADGSIEVSFFLVISHQFSVPTYVVAVSYAALLWN